MFHFLNSSKNIKYENYPEIFHQILEKKIDFNNKRDLNSEQIFLQNQKENLHIVGDSHMRVLWRSLKNDERVKNKFNLINQTYIPRGCYYAYDFYKIDFFSRKKADICTLDDQRKRRDNFISKENTTVIIGGRLPVYLYSSPDQKISRYFDKKNKKFFNIVFKNENNLKLEEGIRNSINDLLENNVKVILIYPVPILDFFPHKKLFDLYISDKDNFHLNLKANPLTSSYSEFLEYAKQSHDLLDSINHPNLIKIYTHELFCDKISDTCKTHDANNIFYIDDDHLSKFGNEKIVNQIFNELNKK